MTEQTMACAWHPDWDSAFPPRRSIGNVALHPIVEQVTARIIERSRVSRSAYWDRVQKSLRTGVQRSVLSCGNLAHACAGASGSDKKRLKGERALNIGIVTSYNDMLSAHRPFEDYPETIRRMARALGSSAQVSAGVPAMCDGVTQGQKGMELSLFSRDVIALGTAIGLSHNVFDCALCLGVCDKIVPGLLIGALSFGHLPVAFVPAGPMPTGLSNTEKSRLRQAFAQGKILRQELLEGESRAYHSPGTCNFFGTANTNQLLMEVMGLHLPGASFVPPGTALRTALTRASVLAVLRAARTGESRLAEIVEARSLVNAIVALHASGGSTNLAIHLIAIGKAAGLVLNWQDFASLSSCVPLLMRLYPNGSADVNHFHRAGGMGFLLSELLGSGLLHEDVATIAGRGLSRYVHVPRLDRSAGLVWEEGRASSLDSSCLQSFASPFRPNGGLVCLEGNLGRGMMKVSALEEKFLRIEAPALLFFSQQDLEQAFREGALERDFMAVLPFQGPRANGMPEMHALTPLLRVLQERGHRVGLVTDGRMSGASGNIPAALHMTPEALCGGTLGKLRSGDRIVLDARQGLCEVLVSKSALRRRTRLSCPQRDGWDLFAFMRERVSGAEEGACVF